MRGFSQSFNVSVAAAICLARAVDRRELERGRHGDLPPGELEALRARFYALSVKQRARIARAARAAERRAGRGDVGLRREADGEQHPDLDREASLLRRDQRAPRDGFGEGVHELPPPRPEELEGVGHAPRRDHELHGHATLGAEEVARHTEGVTDAPLVGEAGLDDGRARRPGHLVARLELAPRSHAGGHREGGGDKAIAIRCARLPDRRHLGSVPPGPVGGPGAPQASNHDHVAVARAGAGGRGCEPRVQRRLGPRAAGCVDHPAPAGGRGLSAHRVGDGGAFRAEPRAGEVTAGRSRPRTTPRPGAGQPRSRNTPEPRPCWVSCACHAPWIRQRPCETIRE